MIYEKDFLEKLSKIKQHVTYAKIIALTLDENPIEEITGKINSGSVNIDGSSSLRRTCSLSLVADQKQLGEIWDMKTKFNLQIGIENTVDANYPNICWFKMGIYVITDFSCSKTVQGLSISLQGQDKMCLINGSVNGKIYASVDFGTQDIQTDTDKFGNPIFTNYQIPIKDIIRESVHEYAQEPWHNIIINDLDDVALEQVQYRGNNPLYVFRECILDSQGHYVSKDALASQMTTSDLVCQKYNSAGYEPSPDMPPISWENTTLSNLKYDLLGGLVVLEQPDVIRFDTNGATYTVVKYVKGETVGYRRHDLVYSGDLITNVGEALTSVLDRIVNMLGDYEYFYDVDGRFIFQRRTDSINVSWNSLDEDKEYANIERLTSDIVYDFKDGSLITSISNNGNHNNIRNDYSIWGMNKNELPIHIRWAIDERPISYTTISASQEDCDYYNNIFGTNVKPQDSVTFSVDKYDWRELIYQMALDYRKFNHWDDFLVRVRDCNIPEGSTESLYPSGYTGYEQYYVDLEGFWRLLYGPAVFEEADPADLIAQKVNYDKICINTYIVPYNENQNRPYTDYYHIGYTPDLKFFIYPFDQCYSYNEIKTLEEDIDLYYKAPGSDTYVPINDSTFSEKERALLDVKNIYSHYNGEGEETADYHPLAEFCFGTDYQGKRANSGYLENTDNIISIEDLWDMYSEVDAPDFNSLTNKIYKELPTTVTVKKVGIDADAESVIGIMPLTYYLLIGSLDEYTFRPEVTERPQDLVFWFDFTDPGDYCDLKRFSVKNIGTRAESYNDDDVRAIYYKEASNVIFIDSEQWPPEIQETGYNYIQLSPSMQNMFTIGTQGKTAKDELEISLYKHTYFAETVTLTTNPIYHLEPNTILDIEDKECNISGKYTIDRITIPLEFNGMTSISATKTVERLY